MIIDGKEFVCSVFVQMTQTQSSEETHWGPNLLTSTWRLVTWSVWCIVDMCVCVSWGYMCACIGWVCVFGGGGGVSIGLECVFLWGKEAEYLCGQFYTCFLNLTNVWQQLKLVMHCLSNCLKSSHPGKPPWCTIMASWYSHQTLF